MKVIKMKPPELTLVIEIPASELEFYQKGLEHEINFQLDKFNRMKATLSLGDFIESEKQETIDYYKNKMQKLWRLKTETDEAVIPFLDENKK